MSSINFCKCNIPKDTHKLPMPKRPLAVPDHLSQLRPMQRIAKIAWQIMKESAVENYKKGHPDSRHIVDSQVNAGKAVLERNG